MRNLHSVGAVIILIALLSPLVAINFFNNVAAADIAADITPGASSKTTDAYAPSPIEINVGDTVTWTNKDTTIHTVTSGTGPDDPNSGQEFDSSPNFDPLMAPNGKFIHTFDKAGEFSYYCGLHINMVGTVIVTTAVEEIQLTVQTDEPEYQSGETITISGRLTGTIIDQPILLQLRDPQGNNDRLDQIVAGSDGRYSYSFTAGGLMNTEGTYVITVSYKKESANTSFGFDIDDVNPNLPPLADIHSVSSSPFHVDKQYQFLASGSSDPDGTITNYSWDFGDGGTGTGVSVTHTYQQTGSYSIKLTVTDDDEATDTDTMGISISVAPNLLPVPSFKQLGTPEVGKLVQFDASDSRDPDGTITNYSWDFGDGGTSTGVSVTHTYQQTGSYSIKLTVTDDDGASVPISKNIGISAPEIPPPEALPPPTWIWIVIAVGIIIAVSVVIVISRKKTNERRGAEPKIQENSGRGPDPFDAGPGPKASYQNQQNAVSESDVTGISTHAALENDLPENIKPIPDSRPVMSQSNNLATAGSKDQTIGKNITSHDQPATIPTEANLKQKGSPISFPAQTPEMSGKISSVSAKPQPTVKTEIFQSMAPKGYEMNKLIGKGGFSSVYLATNTDNNNLVALKIPKIDSYETLGREFADDFVREAKLWKSLVGYSIVKVYDFGKAPLPWIVIEYMEGGNLREILVKKGKIPVSEAADITLKVIDALIEAHAKGIVHLDIKPENILFTKEGEPKVADWGLARILFEVSTTTSTGFKGTLSYSAPEQFDSKKYGPTDVRTDIYQVAAVLYEMLTGNAPFKGDGLADTMMKILVEEPVPPSKIVPELLGKLEPIIMKALAKRKQDRYEYAVEFKREILKVMGKIVDPQRVSD